MCWCSMMSSIRIALVRQKSNVDKSTKRLHTENCGIKLPLTMSSVASNFMSFGYRFISWASENIVRFATNLGSKAHFPSREKCVHIPSTECNQIKFSDFDWSDASRNDMYSGIGLCQIGIANHIRFWFEFIFNSLRWCPRMPYGRAHIHEHRTVQFWRNMHKLPCNEFWDCERRNWMFAWVNFVLP